MDDSASCNQKGGGRSSHQALSHTVEGVEWIHTELSHPLPLLTLLPSPSSTPSHVSSELCNSLDTNDPLCLPPPVSSTQPPGEYCEGGGCDVCLPHRALASSARGSSGPGPCPAVQPPAGFPTPLRCSHAEVLSLLSACLVFLSPPDFYTCNYRPHLHLASRTHPRGVSSVAHHGTPFN